MDRIKDRRYCMVTISDAEFSIASEVLIYSFLKYNPWFKGELLIIADDLPDDHKCRLEKLAPVRVMSPDPRLRESVDRLQAKEPRLKDIYRRLFSLEIFRLAEYDRVVYLDSDMYCSGDISELFSASNPLLACPDGFTYADQIRALLDGSDQITATERYGKTFNSSFNAGVLSVGSELLGESTYTQLLNLLNYDVWQALGESIFTDQMALNIHFENNFTALDGKYNYVIFLEGYQKGMDNLSLLDARIVHFAGPIKPWNCYAPEELLERAPNFIKFIDVWRELLDEARSTNKIADVRRLYDQQREWIKEHNLKNIKPTGRLY
jgi:lipopolysaccharide biosynthesis glycosyltransferase